MKLFFISTVTLIFFCFCVSTNATAKQGRISEMANGDSVYYAFDSKTYKLYTASKVDKQTVLLLSAHAADRNMLVPLTHTFFNKNKELEGFKGGDKVTMELRDTYNYTTHAEGIVLGASDNGTLLIKSGNMFYLLPAVKLKHAN